jgi:hypothetical protein
MSRLLVTGQFFDRPKGQQRSLLGPLGCPLLPFRAYLRTVAPLHSSVTAVFRLGFLESQGRQSCQRLSADDAA